MATNRDAAKEILKGIKIMVDRAMGKTTKIYNGIIVSEATNGKWNIKVNGETHAIAPYKIVPQQGQMVKVIIPDNNMSQAFFI